MGRMDMLKKLANGRGGSVMKKHKKNLTITKRYNRTGSEIVANWIKWQIAKCKVNYINKEKNV